MIPSASGQKEKGQLLEPGVIMPPEFLSLKGKPTFHSPLIHKIAEISGIWEMSTGFSFSSRDLVGYLCRPGALASQTRPLIFLSSVVGQSIRLGLLSWLRLRHIQNLCGHCLNWHR